MKIMPAQAGAALDDFITLAHEYVTWMVAEIQVRYPELDVREFTSEHAYDDLRKKFPGGHVPPDGCLLLATIDGRVGGCIALGRLSPEICEVRTLYVRPEFRGTGVGAELVNAVLDQARGLGYRCARLDTLAFMTSAQRLYRAQGFYDIAPYLDMSEALKHYICFLELKLSDGGTKAL